MNFARWVFRLSGVVGILLLLPLYFFEERITRIQIPVLTHPEYYYGFVGVALAWQVAFFIIASDPIKYRKLMIPAILEKCLYAVSAIALVGVGRTNSGQVPFAVLDLVWAALFIAAFLKTEAS